MSDIVTPTSTLLNCMESFGESEPTRLLVIWVDESGNLRWSASQPYSITHAIGMLETLKAWMLKGFCDDDD